MAEITAGGKYAITGIQTPTALRREISSWFNQKGYEEQTSLFVQALLILQKTSPDERLSYFQIAGIHGFPRVPWDGDTGGDYYYCAHNVITFPVWHRPYLLLFEQVLHEVMTKQIVPEIRDPALRAVWQAAADTFRLPYWDWGVTNRVPDACRESTVTIVMPGGSKKSVDNPLERYHNINSKGKRVPMGDETMKPRDIPDNPHKHNPPWPWSKSLESSRHGLTLGKDKKWTYGPNDHKKADAALKNGRYQDKSSLRDVVGRMLTDKYLFDYKYFASTKFHPRDPPETGPYTGKHFLSLEEVHDQVHGWTGGESSSNGLGHMADVPVAAFDPIFWLHHCNIDRLFVMWRILNPGSRYTRGDSHDPRETDHLRPFHNGSNVGDHHTAKTAWDHLTYRYDYDDTSRYKGNREGLVQHIKKLYPTASSAVKDTDLKISVQLKVGDGKGEIKQVYDDYVINIIYDRYALDGLAYSILFFLVEDVDPLSDYQQHRAYLGKVFTFSVPLVTNGEITCENCARQKKEHVLSTGHIPITVPLIHYIDSILGQDNRFLTKDNAWNRLAIEEVLRDNIIVKFVDIAGEVHNAEAFPNTTFAVLRGKGQIEEPEGIFPTFNAYAPLRVTDKNPLGWSAGSDDRIPSSNELDQYIRADDDWKPDV